VRTKTKDGPDLGVGYLLQQVVADDSAVPGGVGRSVSRSVAGPQGGHQVGVHLAATNFTKTTILPIVSPIVLTVRRGWNQVAISFHLELPSGTALQLPVRILGGARGALWGRGCVARGDSVNTLYWAADGLLVGGVFI